MKKLYMIAGVLGLLTATASAQGNRVSAGGEVTNFGTLHLTPTGAPAPTWTTVRSATPGYFSAVGTATFAGAADAANINGYVKHYANAVNQSFSFPVGTDAVLRTLSVSGTRAANSVIATAWIAGNPHITPDPTNGNNLNDTSQRAATIGKVFTDGQWDWQDLSNNANGVTVTVSIPNMQTSGANAANLRLVGWKSSTNQWVDLGTAGASGLVAGSTLSGTMQSGISAVGIGELKGGPDLSPVIVSANRNFTLSNWTTPKNVVINIRNLSSTHSTTDGLLTFTIFKSSTLTYAFDATATTVTGVPLITTVDNTKWTMTETSFSLTFTLAPGQTIPASGASRIALQLQLANDQVALGSSVNVGVFVNSSGVGDAVSGNNSVSNDFVIN